ncbi:hypothetical protein CMQ_7384 [Grosmannia clavigera kw1407]|uniref:Uncharacterized protein n=1 Tax=Grosmannia clavigera (strain kw1407 / UAMH 11150) TaxID=655863 RepID=F0XQ44_GROCL|nr:uncharacterized protein CMQ_7384 [Grosmannia clavigera kw1407]EFX00382.1 hypothetical protein CMQ_7384 [Grosmannia clavigera kw1407]
MHREYLLIMINDCADDYPSNTPGEVLSATMTCPTSSNVSSRRSSISTNSVLASDISSVVAPQSQRPKLQHSNDPLSRAYPKPERELDVAEALTRTPPKWSLGYWTKNARDMPAPPTSVSRRGLEKAKQELRKAQLDMSQQRSAR